MNEWMEESECLVEYIQLEYLEDTILELVGEWPRYLMVEETKISYNLSCVHIDINSYTEILHAGPRVPVIILLVRGRMETHSTLLWVLSSLSNFTPLDRLWSGLVDREGLRPEQSDTEICGGRWGPVLEREVLQNCRNRSSTRVSQKPLVWLHWVLFLCGTD